MSLTPIYVDLLDAYGRFLRVCGRSPKTVTAYCAVVARFLPVQADGDADDPVRRYLRARGQTLSANSVNLEISALRSWFAWRNMVDPAGWQPSGWPRKRRVPERMVRALDDHEMGVLLAAPDLSTFVGLRDHLIMATLYQCGLRASELVALTLGDVLLDGLLHVHGKGNKYRLVPFGGQWHGLLRTYLQKRAAQKPGKRSALFLTAQGRPLRDGRSVWVIVNRYARRSLGLGCGFSRLEAHTRGRPWQGHYPHLLRASFATELMKSGLDIFAIAQMLGHESAETTTRYLGLDMEHLRVAAAHHPRARRASE
ncbi:tyrosine-type recombinase/integrase [Luteimonas chenhongjianii]|uniref:tyrosine-type recombinase/integrase n=1 Tax=Luteimonas chenhongjianii TaxID=2006110 RepID=UPI0012FDECD7|nr:tyrosine-type recombinase/integrase [Luteimonas chenhongjianii]